MRRADRGRAASEKGGRRRRAGKTTQPTVPHLIVSGDYARSSALRRDLGVVALAANEVPCGSMRAEPVVQQQQQLGDDDGKTLQARSSPLSNGVLSRRRAPRTKQCRLFDSRALIRSPAVCCGSFCAQDDSPSFPPCSRVGLQAPRASQKRRCTSSYGNHLLFPLGRTGELIWGDKEA